MCFFSLRGGFLYTFLCHESNFTATYNSTVRVDLVSWEGTTRGENALPRKAGIKSTRSGGTQNSTGAEVVPVETLQAASATPGTSECPRAQFQSEPAQSGVKSPQERGDVHTAKKLFAELNDQELIEGLCEASEPHFNELYNRYFQRIYNFVYGRIRNHADAEEIVQETFTIVFLSIGNYSGRSSLLSWIYGIAKNTTNNLLRRAKTKHQHMQEALPEQFQPAPSLATCTPEEQLTIQRYLAAIEGELDALGDWQVEIFEMRHLQNFSIGEISDRTGRSSDSIRSSLYRVKRLLMETAQTESPSGRHCADAAIRGAQPSLGR